MDIEIFENKKTKKFIKIEKSLTLLESSCGLSDNLNCQPICHVLQLEFLKDGYNFFSLYDTFKFTISETNSFMTCMKRMIEVAEVESNSIEKVMMIKDSSLSIIISKVNLLISSCDETIGIYKNFEESIINVMSSYEKEKDSINIEILDIQKNIEKLENIENFLSVFCMSSKYIQYKKRMLKNEENEKNKLIENIPIILKNLKKIQKDNISNINFFESVKKFCSTIHQDFQNLSLVTSKQSIVLETKEILIKVDELRRQLDSIFNGIKELEFKFKNM
ncbi:hypothetical protein ACTFIZ_004188 [Dictyostelium cf. discoideum]